MSNLKTSIFTWFGYFLPFKERLERIKDAGFDAVMVAWEDEYPPFSLSRHDFRKVTDRIGLEITNAHSPFIGYNRIWQDDVFAQEDLLELYQGWIKECNDSGIKTLVVHTNDTDLNNYRVDNGLRFFSELGDFADKYNFNIAIENVTRQFLLEEVLENVKNASIGLCYDCGHDYITKCGQGRLLKKYKNRLKAVHLQDNDLYSDKHWLPGEGILDFEKIINPIAESGYDTIALEVKADPVFWAGKGPEEFLKRAHDSAIMLETSIK